MKKKLLIVLAVIMALSLSTQFTPQIQAESEYDKVQKLINKLEADKKRIQADEKRIQQAIKNTKNNINAVNKEIYTLNEQIEAAENEILAKQANIDDTNTQLLETAQLLDEAIARVAQRDEELKTRVRAMYMAGEVSYLDVLLDSKSVGEFLTSLDNLEKIYENDKKILAEHIADKEAIAAHKLEIEGILAQLEMEYEELNANWAALEAKYKERTAMIATLRADLEKANEEIEKTEAESLKIAKELEAAINKRHKLTFDGVFDWPVPDSQRITSNFGTRTDPITGVKSSHNGTDIGAPAGTTIVAAADGIVMLAGWNGSYGNCVMINHGNGVVTLYGHIRNGGIKVKVDQAVKKGQKIAEVGSTGRSTGNHLHFSVIKNNVFIDPMEYLKTKK